MQIDVKTFVGSLQWRVPGHLPREILTSENGDATVWLVDLAGPAADDWRLLSTDEEARACRLISETHRTRFVTCRATLRRLLGARLGVRPDAIAFEYGPAGKPALVPPALHFNVSHSGDRAVIAVADVPVGVDIELVRPVSDLDALTERVFSVAERAALAAVGEDRRLEAFFAAWTRKEAAIKARGAGIGSVVGLGPACEPARSSFFSFCPCPGFAGAVCLEAPDRRWRPV